MTRTLRGSLLIASMLIATWATTSEACHRRRACAPATYCRGYTGGIPTRAPRATTVPGAATAWLAGVTTAGGTAGYPGGYGYVRPARLRLGRHRRAGVRAGGAARPGRRRLRPGALTVHGFSDHPAGARPAGTYGLTRGGVGGGQLMGAAAGYPRPAAGEEARTPTGAAGRRSGGDPALRSGRTERGLVSVGPTSRLSGAEIGIRGSLAAPPLPHHRAYGSVPRRFDQVKRSATPPIEEGRSSRRSVGQGLLHCHMGSTPYDREQAARGGPAGAAWWDVRANPGPRRAAAAWHRGQSRRRGGDRPRPTLERAGRRARAGRPTRRLAEPLERLEQDQEAQPRPAACRGAHREGEFFRGRGVDLHQVSGGDGRFEAWIGGLVGGGHRPLTISPRTPRGRGRR